MSADRYFYQQISEHTQPIVVRLYRFEPSAVTVGYHQNIERAVDHQACKTAGIDVVRRPTGGRSLLHRNEINYAVIADTNRAPLFGRGLANAFRVISEAVALGLQRMGVKTEISDQKRGNPESPATAGTGLCAVSTTRHEITSGQAKIAAAAQLRSSGKLLQHGTIYINEPDPLPSDLFPQFRSTKIPAMLDLQRLLGYSPEVTTIIEALTAGFTDRFGPDCPKSLLTQTELDGIKRMIDPASFPPAN